MTPRERFEDLQKCIIADFQKNPLDPCYEYGSILDEETDEQESATNEQKLQGLKDACDCQQLWDVFDWDDSDALMWLHDTYFGEIT